MSNAELQEEEREVLLSIYEGDSSFNQLSPITYQYKFGEDGDSKSFLLEISWTDSYPTDKPVLNLDTFYNKHILPSVKEKIASLVMKEAEQWLGTAMTYTLFEFVKENESFLLSEQPEEIREDKSQDNDQEDETQDDVSMRKDVKKDRLSKAQKRKQWDRVDSKGERPRGWNWVDVVKHLSQTGSKQPTEVTSSTS